MRQSWTITKRELAGFFASPIAPVFIIIFLILSGFFTFMVGGLLGRGEASLGIFFFWMPWLFLLLVPAVGMRMWAEERRMGTMELLFTLPVSPWQPILGKFLAGWIIVALALVLTFPVVWTVNHLGEPDNGVIAAGYVGTLLLAGSYLAVTSFTSALTRNQVVSFILSVAIGLFLVLSGWPPVTDFLARFVSRSVVECVAALSVMTHYEAIQRGIVDTSDLVYFASVIGLGLFGTSIVLKSHRAG
jgi:ABC-2 type transport system permease protein